jgi:hypothetical protein
MLRLAHIIALRNVPHTMDSCYIQMSSEMAQ